jgi:hypothetical protein
VGRVGMLEDTQDDEETIERVAARASEKDRSR